MPVDLGTGVKIVLLTNCNLQTVKLTNIDFQIKHNKEKNRNDEI